MQYNVFGDFNLINHMTTLTIRIREDLKDKAFHQAEKLGIPLTLVVTKALENFVHTPSVVIGKPEFIKPSAALQKKIDKIDELLSNLEKKGKLPKRTLRQQLEDL